MKQVAEVTNQIFYSVDKAKDSREKARQFQVLIGCTGYTSECDTWELLTIIYEKFLKKFENTSRKTALTHLHNKVKHQPACNQSLRPVMNLYIYYNLHASFRLYLVTIFIYVQGSRIQAISFEGRQVDHFTKGRVTTLIIEPLYATIFLFDCSRPLVRDLYF